MKQYYPNNEYDKDSLFEPTDNPEFAGGHIVKITATSPFGVPCLDVWIAKDGIVQFWTEPVAEHQTYEKTIEAFIDKGALIADGWREICCNEYRHIGMFMDWAYMPKQEAG